MVMIDSCDVRLQVLRFLESVIFAAELWHWISSRCFLFVLLPLGSRGCISHYSNLIIASSPDEPVKRKKSLDRIPSKTILSDTTTCDVDTGGVQSQGRNFTLNTLIEMSDSQSTGSSDNSSEFVNHGLILWNQTRQQWIESRKPKKQTGQSEPRISWRATYDSLLGNNKTFRKPIPLCEMIDFLVDVWEQEGMYD